MGEFDDRASDMGATVRTHWGDRIAIWAAICGVIAISVLALINLLGIIVSI